MCFAVVGDVLFPILVSAVSSGRAGGAGDGEVFETALCGRDVVDEVQDGYYRVTVVSNVFGGFVERGEDGLVPPVLLPKLLDDVHRLAAFKLVKLCVLLRGGRSGAVEMILIAVQVSHGVRDAQVLSQGIDILTAKVLLAVGEAVRVTHGWAVRSAAADRQLVNYCITANSTPFAWFITA